MATTKQNRRNQAIKAPEVRVIDSDGEQIGVLARDEAIKVAEEAGLDLVEVVPNADPPVCRVMDYGKFRFEQNKKAQTNKKKQKQAQLKEVKFRPNTDTGDYAIKMRNVHRFLEEGDKVKITLRFRGREMRHQELGTQLLARVEHDTAEYAQVEQRPVSMGRLMVMMLAPKRKK